MPQTEQKQPDQNQKAPASKKARSRAGCTRCRRHRKRCDEQKPECTRCREVGVACSYELNIKWGGRAFPKMLGSYAGRVQRLNNDNAVEGGGFVYVAQPLPPGAPIRAARAATAEGSAAERRPVAAGNDDHDIVNVPDTDQSLDDATAMTVVRRQPAPWVTEVEFLARTTLGQPARSLEFAPDLSRIHRFLLNHYVHETIRLTAPSDYARTEICRSVVPMSFNQPCLLFAMMAFAARHLNTLGALPVGTGELPGDDAEEVIAELEDRSMSSLRQQLTEPNFNQHAVALATTRTLCQSQILAAGNSWRTHLEGARAILQAASSHAKAATAAKEAKGKGKGKGKAETSTGAALATDEDAAADAAAADADADRRHEQPSIQDFLASWYNNVEALAALTPLGLRRGQLEMASVVGRRNVYFDVFGGLVSDVPDLFREVGALVMERRRRTALSRQAGKEEEEEDDDDDETATRESILSDDDIAAEAASLVRDIHARLEQDTIGSLRMDNNLLVSLSPDNMHDYALSNASFLHTALLYIHCAVQGLPLSAPAVRHSVEQIVWCYGNMKSASALSPRVLMGTPLFTAGLWAMPDAQGAIRGYFETMGTWMRTPHNVRSSALLEYVWSKTARPDHHDVLTYLEESPDFLPY